MCRPTAAPRAQPGAPARFDVLAPRVAGFTPRFAAFAALADLAVFALRSVGRVPRVVVASAIAGVARHVTPAPRRRPASPPLASTESAAPASSRSRRCFARAFPQVDRHPRVVGPRRLGVVPNDAPRLGRGPAVPLELPTCACGATCLVRSDAETRGIKRCGTPRSAHAVSEAVRTAPSCAAPQTAAPPDHGSARARAGSHCQIGPGSLRTSRSRARC